MVLHMDSKDSDQTVYVQADLRIDWADMPRCTICCALAKVCMYSNLVKLFV